MAEECTLFLGGGLNQEDGAYNFPPESGGISPYAQGDYRYALNLRIGSSAGINNGAGENIQSTLQVTGAYYKWDGGTVSWVLGSPPAGTNVAINKYEDRAEGKVYWFVKNSNGNDLILMWVKSERKIYELIQWSGLHFSNFISCWKINKYLQFTDGNPEDLTGNPPRMIDVTDIYKLKATLASNLSEYHISFAKWAPVAPPQIDAVVGLPDGNVFISKGVYQFAYRYIYKGGFRSCWSPPSNFVSNELRVTVNGFNPTPLIDTAKNFAVHTPGFIFDYNNPTNTAFNHTDPQFYYFIDSIEYAYRDSSIANWKVFTRIAVNGVAPSISISFTNGGPVVNVAESDIGQYFDAVPLLSRAGDAIDNRPMMADNLDDFAPMADFAVTNVEVYSLQPNKDNWYNTDLNPAFPPELREALKFQRFSFKENGIYKLGIIGKNLSGRSGLIQAPDNWTYTIPVNLDANPTAQEDFHALGFKIDASVFPADWMVDYQIVRSNCLNIDMFIIGTINEFKFLKFNNGVDNSISTDNQIRTAIGSYYDNYNTGGSQYSLISRILTEVRKSESVSLSDATFIYIDITNWCLDTFRYNTDPSIPSNNVYYNWQPGDRVRFWGSQSANFTGPYIQYDQEIIQYTGTSLIISKPPNLKFMGTREQVLFAGTNAQRLFTIEAYRPKKYSTQSDVLFYEMGEWYPVTQPGTVNRDFSKRDFTWGGAAQITKTTIKGHDIYSRFPVINGDVWLVTKNFFWNVLNGSNPTTQHVTGEGKLGPYISSGGTPNYNYILIGDYPIFPQMNQDRNNAAGFWEHNTGRPLVAYKYLPKQFEKSTQVRFGGKFLEDSLFIGINNFQDANQYIYPSEYGKIRALVNTSNTEVKAVGNILLAIGEEETWSIYINRTTLEDLSGRSAVSLSDKVLGSFNTLLGSYGTLNPESVSKKNSRVLFWNAKRGMWIRYSNDGLTPISDAKMQTWFKDISILLAPTYSTATPAKAISVFDPYFDEWITYLNHSTLPSTFNGYPSYKCVAFAERESDKRWKSFYDYTPELFAAIENETYSIIGTNVHIHSAGADYNSFYGVKKDSMLQLVANAEQRRMKIWKSINLQSSDKWSFPLIEGDFRSNGVTIQNSKLLLTDLQNLEGVFWTDLKRDQNTPNALSTDDGLVNGDVMRARALTMMMTLDPAVTWLSIWNWLVVNYDLSEKTAKK